MIVTHDMHVARQAGRIIEIADGVIYNDTANMGQEKQPDQAELPPVNTASRASLWNSVLESISMAWRALLGHRLRAFLSMLGIIIGIASVVSSVAVGEGARQSVMKELNRFGSITLEIRPGSSWADRRAQNENILKLEDVDFLRQQPWIENVTPVISGAAAAVYGEHKGTIVLTGVIPEFFQIQALNFLEGSPFMARYVEEREPALVIDDTTRKIFFPNELQVEGKIIKLNGAPRRVIGVASQNGPRVIGGMSTAWVPFTSLTERMIRNKSLETILMSFKPGVNLQEGRQKTEDFMTQLHGKRDFFTQSDDVLAEAREKSSSSLSFLITAIAGISLLVGGVGVELWLCPGAQCGATQPDGGPFSIDR